MEYDVQKFSEKYLANIILPFSEYAYKLMSEEIGVKFFSDEVQIKPFEYFQNDLLNIAIVVQLSENVVVLMQIPAKLAQCVGLKLFDEEILGTDDERLKEVCKEYLNIIAGKALTNIKCDANISIPFVFNSFDEMAERRFIHLPVKTDVGKMVMVFLPSDVLDDKLSGSTS